MLPASDEDFRSLEDFFSALGFAPGENWTGRRYKGCKFEAFESGVELAIGEDMPDAELVVEVDNADIVAETARAKGFTFVSDDHRLRLGSASVRPAGSRRIRQSCRFQL